MNARHNHTQTRTHTQTLAHTDTHIELFVVVSLSLCACAFRISLFVCQGSAFRHCSFDVVARLVRCLPFSLKLSLSLFHSFILSFSNLSLPFRVPFTLFLSLSLSLSFSCIIIRQRPSNTHTGTQETLFRRPSPFFFLSIFFGCFCFGPSSLSLFGLVLFLLPSSYIDLNRVQIS